jgi:hypothetical protein
MVALTGSVMGPSWVGCSDAIHTRALCLVADDVGAGPQAHPPKGSIMWPCIPTQRVVLRGSAIMELLLQSSVLDGDKVIFMASVMSS